MLNSTEEYRFIVRGFETEEELKEDISIFTINKNLEEVKDSFLRKYYRMNNASLEKAVVKYDAGMRIIYRDDSSYEVVCLGNDLFLLHGNNRKPFTLELLEKKVRTAEYKENDMFKHSQHGKNFVRSNEDIEKFISEFMQMAQQRISESLSYLSGKRFI